MKETPKEKSARIRRSLIHLPVALFANKNGRSSLLVRLLKSKGFLAGAAIGAAVGLATLVVSYKEKKEDEAKPGEDTPDFNQEDLAKESSVSEVPPPKIPEVPSVPSPKAPPAVKPPDTSLEKPIEKPIDEKSWLDRMKDFFSKPEEKEEAKPGLTEGVVFQSKLAPKSLPDGYRSKFEFSGFNSAKGLSKYGAYTQDEANTIVALKTKGVNTSANAGVMSKDIEQRIRFYSKKHGVSEEVGLKMAQMESGGNPNAISATGAIGVFQFTGRTAGEMGITNRFDPDQNIEAGILMAKKSVKKLTESDLPVTAINIYLMHQLGVRGARELIQAAAKDKKISALSQTTQRAIQHNFGGKSIKTAKEYIANTEEALTARSSSERFASNSSPETAPPVVGSPSAAVQVASVIPQAAPAEKVRAVPVPEHIAVAQDTAPSVRQENAQNPTGIRVAAVQTPEQVKSVPQSVVRTKQGLLIDVS